MAQEAAAKAKTTARPKAVGKEGKWVEAKCAFCQGTGRDPFGVMSVLSNCAVCGGMGTVRVKEPYVPCRACGGRGIQSFTRLACMGCGGKGVSHVEEPTETCPVCKGTGVDGLHLYCLRCHGTGVATAKTADS